VRVEVQREIEDGLEEFNGPLIYPAGPVEANGVGVDVMFLGPKTMILALVLPEGQDRKWAKQLIIFDLLRSEPVE
jgi:hypothetical protein